MTSVEFERRTFPRGWEGVGYSKSPRPRSFSIPSMENVCSPVAFGGRRTSAPNLHRMMVSRQIQKTGHVLSSLSLTEWIKIKGIKQEIPCFEETEHLASIVESLSSSHRFIAMVKNSEGRISGTIDIMDLVSVCYQRVKSASDTDFGAISCRESFLVENGKTFLEAGFGSPVNFLSGSSSLLDLVRILSDPKIKRVTVLQEGKVDVDYPEDVLAIVSQSDVIKYAIDNPSMFYLRNPASECISTSQIQNSIEDEETIVKDQFRVSASFKAIWDKQNLGGVYCHGLTFLDKFLNWMVHIVNAEVQLEDVSVECNTSLLEIMKLVQKQSVSEVVVAAENGETLGFVEVHGIMIKLLEIADFASKRTM